MWHSECSTQKKETLVISVVKGLEDVTSEEMKAIIESATKMWSLKLHEYINCGVMRPSVVHRRDGMCLWDETSRRFNALDLPSPEPSQESAAG